MEGAAVGTLGTGVRTVVTGNEGTVVCCDGTEGTVVEVVIMGLVVGVVIMGLVVVGVLMETMLIVAVQGPWPITSTRYRPAAGTVKEFEPGCGPAEVMPIIFPVLSFTHPDAY